jgi:hypothetical protein
MADDRITMAEEPEEPTAETVAEWLDTGECETVDGCRVALDVTACPHGSPSWLVVLGYVPAPDEG